MKAIKYYWFEFADGYSVCTRGFSRQEMQWEVYKHGELLRVIPA